MQTCRYCTFYMASCMANNYRLLVDIFHGDLHVEDTGSIRSRIFLYMDVIWILSALWAG